MSQHYVDLQQAAQKITGDDQLWEELLHYCLEEFLVKPNVEEIVKSGGARFYIVRMMMNQFRSTTSPFYTKYRQPTTDIDFDIPDEEQEEEGDLLTQIQNALDHLEWYDKLLFETLVKDGHTVSSLSRATGIPRSSVNLTITRVREYLKKSLSYVNRN